MILIQKTGDSALHCCAAENSSWLVAKYLVEVCGCLVDLRNYVCDSDEWLIETSRSSTTRNCCNEQEGDTAVMVLVKCLMEQAYVHPDTEMLLKYLVKDCEADLQVANEVRTTLFTQIKFLHIGDATVHRRERPSLTLRKDRR